jgi:single-strand DNA-binding protein
MAGETVITVVGNLTADPELKFTGSGVAFANFTIASTPRTFDRQNNEWKDGEALFLRATVWRDYAEHVANSLTKGMRVIAQGSLRQRSYETKEGERRTSYELDVDEVGPSLRFATAQVNRTPAQGGGGGGFGGGRPAGQSDWGKPAAPQGGDNPWGSAGNAAPQGGGFGSGFDDEQPF